MNSAVDTQHSKERLTRVQGVQLPGISIRTFLPQDAAAFSDLNRAWIEEFFSLEPQDLPLLADPETNIRKAGGEIFIATCNGEAIACCALLPLGSGVFEIIRMTVRSDYRGHGIGRILLNHVIDSARALGATRLILETSNKLKAATALYDSLNFRRVQRDGLIATPLARADLFMELVLPDH